MTSSSPADSFVTLLLDWYAGAKRDLPWRRTRDPYAVWVSEMMLQQTLVATVIPYWTRWMESFPTIRALAEAPLDDVLKQWQGLGYYARARNLHSAAKVIIERHGGVFPTLFDDVLALPGIGRYTAGAVCSIALGQDVPLVDANVIRVFCRVFGLTGDPKSPKVQSQLWKLAEKLIPAGRASEFNQAMMELGALICQAKPRCESCPVNSICAALATGQPQAFPEFAPKPEFTTHTDVSAIVRHPGDDRRMLLVQRYPEGLWGGLWEFPRVSQDALNLETLTQTAERAALETTGLTVAAESDEPLGTVRHGVTTHRITLRPISCRQTDQAAQPQPIGCSRVKWVTLDEINDYALSSPQARLAELLRTRSEQPTLKFE